MDVPVDSFFILKDLVMVGVIGIEYIMMLLVMICSYTVRYISAILYYYVIFTSVVCLIIITVYQFMYVFIKFDIIAGYTTKYQPI